MPSMAVSGNRAPMRRMTRCYVRVTTRYMGVGTNMPAHSVGVSPGVTADPPQDCEERGCQSPAEEADHIDRMHGYLASSGRIPENSAAQL